MILRRKTYKDCNDLPLYNFIKVITTDNKKWLLSDKDNWLLKPDLETIWDDIFMNYIELSNDNRSSAIFSLVKEITILRQNINIINDAMYVLSRTAKLEDHKDTISILKKTAGVYFTFSKDTIQDDIKKTFNHCKRMLVDLDILMGEYKKLSSDESQKATEFDYVEQIIALEKYMGISIDTKTTTVAKYIGYVNALKKEADGKR